MGKTEKQQEQVLDQRILLELSLQSRGEPIAYENALIH